MTNIIHIARLPACRARALYCRCRDVGCGTLNSNTAPGGDDAGANAERNKPMPAEQLLQSLTHGFSYLPLHLSAMPTPDSSVLRSCSATISIRCWNQMVPLFAAKPCQTRWVRRAIYGQTAASTCGTALERRFHLGRLLKPMAGLRDRQFRGDLRTLASARRDTQPLVAGGLRWSYCLSSCFPAGDCCSTMPHCRQRVTCCSPGHAPRPGDLNRQCKHH